MGSCSSPRASFGEPREAAIPAQNPSTIGKIAKKTELWRWIECERFFLAKSFTNFES